MSIKTVEREIIVDLMRNRGSTIKQVQHRIKSASPVEVGRALVGLRDTGHVRERGDRYEITQMGLRAVWKE